MKLSLLMVSVANLQVGATYLARRAHGMSSLGAAVTGMKLSFCVVIDSIGTKSRWLLIHTSDAIKTCLTIWSLVVNYRFARLYSGVTVVIRLHK